MEISLIGPQTIRIKGKKGSILVDPTGKIPKTPADASIVFGGQDISYTKVDGQRIIIDGAGEYEVSTIKVKAEKNNGRIIYNFTVDSVEVLLARVEDLTGENKAKFSLIEAKDYAVVVLLASIPVPKDLLGTIDTKILAFFGQEAGSLKDADGKQTSTMNKITVTSDKLPQDSQVIILQ